MISGRRAGLVGSYEALKKYGVYLLSQVGDTFVPCISVDDPGFFLYVPLLSNVLGVDVLEGASIFVALISLSVGIAFAALAIFLGRSLLAKITGLLIACLIALKINTVCDVYSGLALAFVPLPFLLIAFERKSYQWLFMGVFLLGFLGSVSGLIRSWSELPVYLFGGIFLFFDPYFSKNKKLIALLFALMGAALPLAHYQYVLYKKNHFLISQQLEPVEKMGHHFWHNVYIGFGFTRNPYGIIWADECSVMAARKIVPGISEGNPEYNAIKRRQVIDFLKNDRHFFFTSLFARFGVIVMFFLVWFGWLGLLCSYFYSKPWYQECAFFLAFATSALPGLITLPVFQYIEGFVVCTVLYVIYSLIIALNAGMINDVSFLFRKMLKKLYRGTKAYLSHYSDL